jgi:cobalt-zinc-cadmium efflux system protein
MIFGLLIQSRALISDVVHNLSDIAARGFSYCAEKVARRPAAALKTYGYRKIEFVAAFVNSIILHEAIIRAVQEILLHKYGINHTTIQILPSSADGMEHCNHCN